MKQVLLVAAVAMVAALALAPQASATLHVTDVYHVQMGMIPVGDSVSVDSLIVTTIDKKPTTFGVTAQEIAGGPYCGVMVYMGYQKPDTVGGVGLEVGDLISVVGVVAEYTAGSLAGTVTEIDFVHVTLVQEDYGEVAPIIMSCQDLGYLLADSTCAEQWEGAWLALDTVVVTAHLTYAEWLVSEAHGHAGACRDTMKIDDKIVDPTLPRPNVGDTLALIRGACSYEYDTYRLWPRDDSDIVYIGLPPGPNVVVAYPTASTKINVLFDQGLLEASAEDVNNYALSSGTAITLATLDGTDEKLVHLTTGAQPATQLDVLTVCDVMSGFSVPQESCQTYEFRAGICPISFVQTPSAGDTSQCVGDQVTVTGIVSSPTAAFGGEYFLQTRSAGPWNGIYVYQFTNTFNAGDSVVVSGIVQEYYGMTELVSLDYQLRPSTGKPVKIKTVTPATIKTGSATAESYEGTMVQLDSVEVYSLFDTHGEWTVGEGTDSVWIGTHGVYTYVPGIGSIVTVKGPLDYAYGNHKIQPRDSSDIVEIWTCSAGVTPTELSLNLYQNTPNPFGAETSIRFAVPSKSRVSLAVYDVNGRLVNSILDRKAEAGEYRATWNGRDSAGAQVSPGVYFIRLATPYRALEKKMVYVR
jgi:hypothetical protein